MVEAPPEALRSPNATGEEQVDVPEEVACFSGEVPSAVDLNPLQRVVLEKLVTSCQQLPGRVTSSGRVPEVV